MSASQSTNGSGKSRRKSEEDAEFSRDLERSRQGDLAALDHWAIRLHQELMEEVEARRQRRKIKGTNGSSELVQETVARIRGGSIIFPGSTYSGFKRWARTVLLNLQREYRRHSASRNQDRHLQMLLRLLGNQQDNSHELLKTEEELERVIKAIDQLEEHEQLAIKLRIFENLSFVQIGELYRQTPDAARKAFDRAIGKLRRILGHHE